ncbi:MAG TPA: methionine--tRNA ligase [Nitrososphaeraceae archaeon]|nr:methionine--tRNA ligase [Nitrososphaeraceae archaeon]
MPNATRKITTTSNTTIISTGYDKQDDSDKKNNNKTSHNNNGSTSIRQKSAVVTSALPYANGEIHIGHIASTYLPADIFTRFCRLTGREVYHVCASDDFGTPVLIRAEKENKTPGEYVGFWNKRDYEDFKLFGISFDFFYKTSSKENVEFVQFVFKRLYENGHIYEQDVVQFYCQYDDKFLPDRYVIGKCPNCGAENQYSDLCEKCGKVPDQILDPKCAICGRPPIKKSSKHYFFKLSNFSKQLKGWLNGNANLQSDIKNYVINWIDEGLEDWDITRDLSWGVPIPMPDAKGKVFYGWFDNHLCYISTLNTLIQEQDKKVQDKERQKQIIQQQQQKQQQYSYDADAGKKYWNNSEIYHFIGKDIVYHHYLFLPAMRLGINEEYKLPDYIPTRGHLMLQNQKISKSRNWYIGLRDFASDFNPDYLRFYIASIAPYSQTDVNFDWDVFFEKINNELIANIGNFINRALYFVQKTFDSRVPMPSSEYDLEDRTSILEIEKIADEVGGLIEKNEFDRALKRILKFATHFNQYFQKKQPWSNQATAKTTLFIAVNAVRSLAIMLEPFIPISSEKVWSQLGFENNNNIIGSKISNGSSSSSSRGDTNIGGSSNSSSAGTNSIHKQQWTSASEIKIQPGHVLGRIEPIFRKIQPKDIQLQKAKLGKQEDEQQQEQKQQQ